MQLSNDLGLKKEHEEYSKQLKKAHKSIEIKEQVRPSTVLALLSIL